MISIKTENISKKYKQEWIFKNLNLEIHNFEPLAIIGPNGSGKSTLIQSLAGIIPINSGKISYSHNSVLVLEEDWHSNISYCAPYMELIEEFTLKEAVDFHQKFKNLTNLSTSSFLKAINLEMHSDKTIKNFSSGMRQKLKLGLAFFSESKVLFLDEPTTNLDQKGFEWYLEEIENILPKKQIIISSNEPKEYSFCKNHLNILNFKA